jgi:signal transduction histidine kinase/DNA-binding response OmpR family regulator
MYKIYSVLFICISLSISQERPFVTKYDERDHHGLNQNFDIIQGNDDLIYIANNAGLLIYDGLKWKIKITKKKRGILSLSMGNDGTIYWGGSGEFGFVDTNFNLISLSQQIKLNIDDVWRCHAVNDKIYFMANDFVFVLKNKIVEPIKLLGSTKRSFLVDDTIFYVSLANKLYSLQNDSDMNPLAFAEKVNAVMIERISDEEILIITFDKKVYYLNKNSILKELFVPSINKLESNIYSAKILKNDHIMIGLSQGGIIEFDEKFRIVTQLNKKKGYSNSRFTKMIYDIQDNLWLTTENEILKLEYAENFSYLNSEDLQNISSFVNFEKKLFIGTLSGLYTTKYNEVFEGKLDKVLQMNTTSVWTMEKIGEQLLIGSQKGLFRVYNNNFSLINKSRALSITISNDQQYFYVGSVSKLFIYDNKTLTMIKEIEFKQLTEILYIEEDLNNKLWLATRNNGLIRISLSGKRNKKAQKIDYYSKKDGLIVGGGINLNKIDGKIHFMSNKGEHEFDQYTNTFKIKKDATKLFNTTECMNIHTIQIKNKEIVAFHNHLGAISTVNKELFSRINGYDPLRRFSDMLISTAYWDGSRFWIGTKYGEIVSYIPKDGQVEIPPIPKVKISEIIAHTDTSELIFQYPNTNINRSFVSGNIEFNLMLINFVENKKAEYQYKLENYNTRFSSWTKSHNIKFLSLKPGDYTLKFRAKNIYNQLSKEETFSFNIIRPWFLKWYSLVLYLLIFSLIIHFLIKFRLNRVENKNIQLQRIVDEKTLKLKEQLIQLENVNSDLKEMDRIKSEFFSNISHEFRTPLSLILNPIETLISDEKNAKKVNILNVMRKNAERVLDQINKILNVSKSSETDFFLTYSLLDLSDLIHFVSSMLSSLAESKKIKVDMDLEPILIALDEERMKDVLINLISNAINYSPQGSRILIKLKRTSSVNAITLSIEDNGYGISENDLKHIFDRYFSIKKTDKYKHSGLGLGLYITKRIIEKHKGRIDVKSKANSGTIFTIELPIQPEIFEKAALNFSLNKKKETNGSKRVVDKIIKETDSNLSHTILLVEDVDELTQYVAEELSEDYRIITASNGSEALQKIEKTLPDLIISDIMMPEMDGFKFCKKLKENDLTNDISIIFLTGLQDEADRLNAYGLGVDNFLQKPFNINELRLLIEKLINKRNLLKEKYKKLFSLELNRVDFESIEENFLKRFLVLIEDHISNSDLNMDYIASEIGVSRTQLYSKIESLTDETPKGIIRNLRLKRAEEMLRNHSGSISEISYKVGFKNASYFASVFQKKYGFLPSDLLKK